MQTLEELVLFIY